MYLKILTNPAEGVGERTIILDNVKEVRYLACKLSSKEYRQFADGANQRWTTGAAPEEGQTIMLGTLDILQGKKNEFILFDRVAFLCNDEGKAVERFLVP